MSAGNSVTPRILERPEHPISRRDIDPNVLKILYRLIAADYAGYLVGGGVRDLMMGRRPKDFDVATSAHPQQVRDLFRNSRLIGRRFRLVHVFFGQQNIEVATFRRRAEDVAEGDDPEVRMREDPVRMIRAVRFATKLDFAIEPSTRAAIEHHCGDLAKSSVPRLVEEIFRTLTFRGAERALFMMEELGLLEVLLPKLSAHLRATTLA